MKRKVGQGFCINGNTKVYVNELDSVQQEIELVLLVPNDIVITKRDRNKIFKAKK